MQSGANVSQPQRMELPWREPLSVARRLAERDGEAGLIWLDGDGSDLGRWVTLASDPQEVICCRGLPGEADANDPFAALDRLGPGHWTGWLSYEAAAWCEPTNPWSKDSMASLWLARHDPLLRFDLQRRQLWIEGSDVSSMQRLAEHLDRDPPPGRPAPVAIVTQRRQPRPREFITNNNHTATTPH